MIRPPSLLQALGLALLLLPVLPVRAQRIFPQQTGWTFSRTSGTGSFTNQTARALAVARSPELTLDPGTELVVAPDGSYSYRITDPGFKFGSAYQDQTTQQQESGGSTGVTLIIDQGYSVFTN